MTLVLVIDDDHQQTRFVSKALEVAGFDTMAAHDGAEGMQMLREFRPQLVITDLIMPVMEGIESIVEIRRTSPAMRIIAMSGAGVRRGGMDFLEAAMKLGADATLRKPFRVAELLDVVDGVLADAAPQQATAKPA
jgi:DNA-binding response OmpR family regulator